MVSLLSVSTETSRLWKFFGKELLDFGLIISNTRKSLVNSRGIFRGRHLSGVIFVVFFSVRIMRAGTKSISLHGSRAASRLPDRETERHGRHQPQSGAGRGRRVPARVVHLGDRQLELVHMVRDALHLDLIQFLISGHHQAVQLRFGRTERQHHVIADRFPDVHRAGELIVLQLQQRSYVQTNKQKTEKNNTIHRKDGWVGGDDIVQEIPFFRTEWIQFRQVRIGQGFGFSDRRTWD